MFHIREDVFILRLADGDNAEVGFRFPAFHSAAKGWNKVWRPFEKLLKKKKKTTSRGSFKSSPQNSWSQVIQRRKIK